MIANKQLNGEKLKLIPQKNRNKTSLLSPYLFKTVLVVQARTVRQLSEIKEIQSGNKEVKVVLFQGIIMYRSELKTSTKALLQLINIFSAEVTWYKINSEK